MHDVGLHRIAVVHLGDVVHVDHRAADALDRQIAQIGDLRRRAVESDGIFVVADFLGAGGRGQILRGERVGDVEAGQAARLQRRGVEVVHHLRRLAAERVGDARPLDRDQAGAHEVETEIRQILFRQPLARERKLDDRHGRGAVIHDQWRCRAGWQLFDQGLRDGGDLGVGGGDVHRRMKKDLDDAERGVRVRFDMFDVVDRRGQGALVGGENPPRHVIRWHPRVLPCHPDDRDVDGREDIHGHAHGGENADEQDEQRCHDERVGPIQCKSDYREH